MLEQLNDTAKKVIDNKRLDELIHMQTEALEAIGVAQAQMLCGMMFNETYVELERVHLLTFYKCQELIEDIRDGEKND